MEQEIKIHAQPRVEPQMCDFVLEKPLENVGAYRFDSPEEAKGSFLAEELFEIDGVKNVLVVGSTITVTKDNDQPWPVIGREIGQAIRRALKSEKPLIADACKKRTDKEKQFVKKVSDIIQNRINPAIASHGGFIELLDVKDKDVFIRMAGGCQGCAASTATLKQGVEKLLKEEIPGLGQVIDTTDHAAGTNPYYS